MAPPKDIHDIFAFLGEAGKLGHIERRTSPIGLTRRENTAEHSYHLALMAMVLADEIDPEVDLNKVIRMLIVHDLPEVYADDSFIFTRDANQSEIERKAAHQLFGMLPPKRRDEFLALWEEFEAGETPEAIFARAMDRLQPTFNNYHNDGGTWVEFGISADQVIAKNEPIRTVSASVWAKMLSLLDEAKTKGYFASSAKTKKTGTDA